MSAGGGSRHREVPGGNSEARGVTSPPVSPAGGGGSPTLPSAGGFPFYNHATGQIHRIYPWGDGWCCEVAGTAVIGRTRRATIAALKGQTPTAATLEALRLEWECCDPGSAGYRGPGKPKNKRFRERAA